MTKEDFISALTDIDEKFISEANPVRTKNIGLIKRISIAAASLMLVAIISIVAIVVPKLQASDPIGGNGMGGENSGILPSDFSVFTTDKTEFDIDNVYITYYFGCWLNPSDLDINNPKKLNVPEFDVFFANKDHEMISLIRHSDENYISEEYRCFLMSDERNNICIRYNHSEIVKIPRELFNQESGTIYICVAGNELNVFKKYRNFTTLVINYEVKENKVKFI